MKTINTTLPVYNRLSKQCYQRSGKNSVIGAVPCPQYRLPAMQWNVEDDDPGVITEVYLIDASGNDTNAPVIFENWFNDTITPYEALTSSGLDIISAINTGGSSGKADLIGTTSVFQNIAINETVRVTGFFHLVSGTAPAVLIYEGTFHTHSFAPVEGWNTFEVTFHHATYMNVAVYNLNTNTSFSFVGVKIAIGLLNGFFQSLPSLDTSITDEYFQYDGDTLNFNLPFGLYYLKFVTTNGYIYYSEWFEVTCIYPNLISSFTNNGCNSFNASGVILNDIWCFGAGDKSGYSNSFSVEKGETIKVIFYHSQYAGGMDYPSIELRDTSDHTTLRSNSELVTEGLNEVTFIATATDDVEFTIFNLAGDTSNFSTTEILVMREYSAEYTRIDFSNTCDLGDIVYAEGLSQTLWIKSELMEAAFPMTPEGSEDGNGLFVPTFRRQEKLQIIRTPMITQVMVECLYRLMLHDTITIIDLVGDAWTVKSLETEHEWQGDDKYFALAVLTFDLNETFVISGCCNNIT